MTYIVANAQHIGKREEQQDSFAFSDPRNRSLVSHGGLLGLVADGMGGMAYGSEAGVVAKKEFLRTYEKKSPGDNIPDTLRDALYEANRAVLSFIAQKGMTKGDVGTTLSAAVIHGGNLYWISVGDSRIYLYRKGRLFQITESHTILDKLYREVAAGRISKNEALKDPERNVLNCYLGIDQLEDIDISVRPYRLEPADRVIICSDGLFDVLSDEEIASEISINRNFQDCCERLVRKVLSKNNPHQDNITVIAMGVNDKEERTPLYTSEKSVKKKDRYFRW